MVRATAVGTLLIGAILVGLAACAELSKVNAATTQAATVAADVGTVVATTTPPGTPVSNVAVIITGVATGILALEKVVAMIVASMKTQSSQTTLTPVLALAPADATAKKGS